MNKQSLSITGMTCEHCASAVREALNALPGVSATVSLNEGLARVTFSGEQITAQLLEVVESKGYCASLVDDEANAATAGSADNLHVAIVGTGSGAFAAAIKAVEAGARVTVIEGADVIGGTCVNIGCVPSKILIRGAYITHLQGHHAVDGLPLNRAVIDRRAMVAQQQVWVDRLRSDKYEHILESNPGITLLRGMARLQSVNSLIITQADGTETVVKADRVLLAVGASPARPDIPGLSDTPYWTSTEALVAESVPKHLIVLGGSVIALELAQAFRHLGAEVTVVARSTLLSKEEPELGEGLKQIFEGEGIKIMLHASPESVHHDGQLFSLVINNEKIRGDQLLVATGRQPNTAALKLDNAGVETDQRGGIIIDDHMRTNVENIYAAGDCTNQPQFVYVAAAAGTRAAGNMTGDDIALDLSVMPAVVFTNPQVASVGLTMQQAESQGLNVESRTLDLENVPRALANFDTRGLIKLVAEQESGRILGCQLLAAEGGEIIQTAALAIQNGMTIRQLADQLFPYLTMVEGLKLCAQTFSKDVKQLSCCAG